MSEVSLAPYILTDASRRGRENPSEGEIRYATWHPEATCLHRVVKARQCRSLERAGRPGRHRSAIDITLTNLAPKRLFANNSFCYAEKECIPASSCPAAPEGTRREHPSGASAARLLDGARCRASGDVASHSARCRTWRAGGHPWLLRERAAQPRAPRGPRARRQGR